MNDNKTDESNREKEIAKTEFLMQKLLTKGIRNKELKNTEFGRIPKEWEIRALREICEFSRGLSYRGQEKFAEEISGGYLFLTLNSVKEGGGLKENGWSWIRTDRVGERHFVREGDIVVANTEQSKDGSLLGSPALVYFPSWYKKDRAVYSHHISKLELKGNLHHKFLFYYLSYVQPMARKYSTGTGVWGLDIEAWSNGISISIPPFEEQRKIGDILFELDEKIQLNNRMNKTLEDIAQAIFKRWFIDFEFPNENGEPYKSSGGEMVESELGMIPKGWEILTLGDYGEFKNGINYVRSESGDAEFFIVNVRNIVNNKFILKNSLDKIKIDLNKAKSYFLMDKDILIARSASPGEVSLVLGNLQNIIYSGFSIRYRLKRPDGYLYMFLVMQKLKEQLSSFSVGTTLQSINQETLKKMKFILPSIEVLNRFNVMAGYILEKTYINLIENYSLFQIRDLLLPKLMTGKIRVPLEEQNVQ